VYSRAVYMRSVTGLRKAASRVSARAACQARRKQGEPLEGPRADAARQFTLLWQVLLDRGYDADYEEGHVVDLAGGA
jgi:hypothetical protein